MMFKINEIFYSLQGEGAFTGTPAVFVRFAGCNLRCPFCDTDFEDFEEMSEEDIVREVVKYPAMHVVITGGEPLLQLTTSLVEKLQARGRTVQIETNGTKELPVNCEPDWITCSPKFAYCKNAKLRLDEINELKVVFDGKTDMAVYDDIEADEYCLQPCDTGDEVKNKQILEAAIEYCMQHPWWRLSLQTHKLIGVR